LDEAVPGCAGFAASVVMLEIYSLRAARNNASLRQRIANLRQSFLAPTGERWSV